MFIPRFGLANGHKLPRNRSALDRHATAAASRCSVLLAEGTSVVMVILRRRLWASQHRDGLRTDAVGPVVHHGQPCRLLVTVVRHVVALTLGVAAREGLGAAQRVQALPTAVAADGRAALRHAPDVYTAVRRALTQPLLKAGKQGSTAFGDTATMMMMVMTAWCVTLPCALYRERTWTTPARPAPCGCVRS
jgi:hypothetical protein